MRLITKINIYFGIILVALMVMVFTFTQYFFHKELSAQTEASLRVTYESFKLSIEKIFNEQEMKVLTQTKRDIIGITTKDHISSVLNYYLKPLTKEYGLNLIEVVTPQGNVLADNNHVYTALRTKVFFKKPGVKSLTASYLTLRGDNAYLMTTAPITFSGELAGYMNVGTLVDQDQMNHFASILHSELLFYADRKLLTANPGQTDFPENVLPTLGKIPASGLFLPGNRINRRDFDYIFFSIPSDGSFKGVVGLANSRATVLATLLRLRIFLLTLTCFGAVFGFFGANLLARNIKRSIFGMEPHEIASLLDQRTAILQSTFEGIIALDKKGCITLINKEAQRLLPSDPFIIGEPVVNFFPDLKLKDILPDGKAIYNHQQVVGESVIVYNCVPIKTKISILGAVMTLRDLTEFQKVAAELMEVKNYTQALRAQSHEFMNKLQSVSGLIQLGKYETALVLLHEATESHQDLVSFLTNSFARSAVSGILLGKFNRANELSIKFEIDRSSYIPQGVIIPDHELVCIVGNLIENAFESLKNSSLTPKIVRVRIRPVKHRLKITVVDNGPGIPLSIKDHIFERGFTSKKGLNKGIGLSLVKQYVENLRGKIRFRSGKQTVFIVQIPLRDGGC